MGRGQLSSADFERARSWLSEIILGILPVDQKWQDEGAGPERRFLGQGGLQVNLKTGEWYWHTKRDGGISPIRLVRLVKDCTTQQAIEHLSAFLANHEGYGSCKAESGDDFDDTPASRADAERIRDLRKAITGTAGQIILTNRGLPPPYPGSVGWIDDARPGEGAIVADLTWRERLTGYLLEYVDPRGGRSGVLPVRRRFNLEKAPGAIIAIRKAGDRILGAEGLPDGLSLA
jgi:hypothetical protein